MAGYTLSDIRRFAASGRMRTTRKPLRDVRDALVRGKHGKVHYFVWGNRVSTYNPRTGHLSVSSAGWETNLTKNRLNKVLPKGHITQKKFSWYYKTNGKTIPFKGRLRLNVGKNSRLGGAVRRYAMSRRR